MVDITSRLSFSICISIQENYECVQENGRVTPQSNGIGKSIANFFKNIGHSKDGSRLTSPNSQTSSRHRLASTSTPQFPPLLLDTGTLQADGSKNTPSPQPGDKRPLAATNSDASTSAQDEQLSPTVLKSQNKTLSKSLDELE